MRRTAAFTLVDVAMGVALFGLVSLGAIYAVVSAKTHQRETAAALRQSAYTTFQASVALEGVDPSKVPNPLGAALTETSTGSQPLRLAGFERNAVSNPSAARTVLSGASDRIAIAYDTGGTNSRGTGFGYAIQAGTIAPPRPSLPLLAPIFRIYGNLNGFTFPLNNIATLPSTNPPGTVYRFTSDGSIPTETSPLWNNDPAWSPLNFPPQVTVRAFNADSQFTPSPVVSTSYSYTVSVYFSRADARSTNLYTFSMTELASPATSGIVLSSDFPSVAVRYSLDASDPTASGMIFSAAFTPSPAQFAPQSILKAVAISTDPRYPTAGVVSYPLSPQGAPLPSPSIITDNSASVDPGTSIAVGYSFPTGIVKTAVDKDPINYGTPALNFPIN